MPGKTRGNRVIGGPTPRRGMTRAEILVLGLTVALLGALLLPTFARGQHSPRATCLQNLRAIGMATQMYAEDDEVELLLPIHVMTLTNTNVFGGDFLGTHWAWRTANWFVWGGATANDQFFCAGSSGPFLGQDRTRYWGAQTRPLTLYLYPDLTEDPDHDRYVTDLPIFRCPQDAGYPDDPNIDDSPIFNAGRSCYATLGNSYRAMMNSRYAASVGSSSYKGAFSFGPWGHKRSDLVNTSRVVLIGEPVFFASVGSGDSGVDYVGWHDEVDSDHVLYVDGSARATQVTPTLPIPADPRLPVDPMLTGSNTRADQFQLDCYPTPGALIWAYNETVRATLTQGDNGDSAWPFKGYKDNLSPVVPPWRQTP